MKLFNLKYFFNCGSECNMGQWTDFSRKLTYMCKKYRPKIYLLFRLTMSLTKVVHLIYFLCLDVN